MTAVAMPVYSFEKARRDGGTWKELFNIAHHYNDYGGAVRIYVEKVSTVLSGLTLFQSIPPTADKFDFLIELTFK